MKPYYDDGSCVIYHGDCLGVLGGLPRVDLVFTSPPYNLGSSPGGQFGHWRDGGIRGGNGKWSGVTEGGMDYGQHDDAMPPAEYERWQKEVLTACWAGLDDGGAIFYNHKPRVQAQGLWLPLTLNPGLPLRQVVIWARAGGTNFAGTHFVPTHEWLMVLAKPAFRLKSVGVSGLGDVWVVPQERQALHPAPFPLGLPARAIEAVAPRLVLDPFLGSGTTLRAAKDAGVRAIGIEIEERYCEIAAKRLAQEVLPLEVTA